jgi:hypothetical protein
MNEAITLDDYVKHVVYKKEEQMRLFDRFSNAYRHQRANVYERRPSAMPICGWFMALDYFSQHGKIPASSALKKMCKDGEPVVTLCEFSRVDTGDVLNKIKKASEFKTANSRWLGETEKTTEEWGKALRAFTHPTIALPPPTASHGDSAPSAGIASRVVKRVVSLATRPLNYPRQVVQRFALASG